MKKLLPYFLVLFTFGCIAGAFLVHPVPEPAGDIVEYYGITESVIRHASLALSSSDQSTLSHALHPEYFSNPGYYIKGIDGNRYPVHFIVYSLILIPLRLLLQALHQHPLLLFPLGNTMIFFLCLIYIIEHSIRSSLRQGIIIAAAITSPLLFFLSWPGPDIFSLSLLLVALVLFYENNPATAAIITAIASWQSQPLIVISVLMGIYTIIKTKRITPMVLAICISLIPYIYNMYIFGVLTPWQTFADGWTKLYGFGIQNLSVLKLYEQLFDLNIGVFWYAPILTIAGCVALIRSFRSSKGMWVILMLLAALFAFQTNPAWHYGTSGYGPTRHAIVLIPFLIAAMTYHTWSRKLSISIIGLMIVSQIYVLSYNNYIFPIFTNTLVHSPVAQFVLDRWPALYNPTPEIFVDRTNHTDLDHPTSAVYTLHGVCKKAYILTKDIDTVTNMCGPFPQNTAASIMHPDRDGFYVNYE